MMLSNHLLHPGIILQAAVINLALSLEGPRCPEHRAMPQTPHAPAGDAKKTKQQPFVDCFAGWKTNPLFDQSSRPPTNS